MNITANVRDIAGVSDNTTLTFWSLLREGSDNASIVTSKRVRVKPVNGVLTVDLDPGPAKVRFHNETYLFTVPDSDASLWDLIEAAVAVPPDTSAEALAAAIEAYLDANPPSGGGAVDSVVAGTNIDVDATDPANPVVSVEALTADDFTDGTTNKAYTATEKTKLAGIATGATANSSDATLLNRANHTGTQSADTLTDGTTNKAFLATERTKLSGIATGATANDTDANLKARANHTGTQTSSTISDLTEAVQDIVGAFLSGTSGVSVSYDDTANTITVSGLGDSSATAETIRDTIGVALLGAGLVSVTVNDVADTITISTTATANDTDANLKARANHTGTQSADTITDGTTNKAYTATEKTKLSGIATGATANSSDATLLNRANHTGTQSADTLTDGTTNKAFLATERTKLSGIATGANVAGPATVGGNWYLPGYTSGQYYPCNSQGVTATGNTLGFGTVRLSAWVVTQSITISRLFAEHTVLQSGTSYRIGIYNDDGTGKPGTLVLDAGTIDTSVAAAVQEVTVSQALTPGLYWVGGAVQGAGTQPTMRTISTNGIGVSLFLPFGSTLPSAGAVLGGWQQTSVSGALPSTLPSPTQSGLLIARIGFKVA